MIRKIGIVTGGGDVPGLNVVIKSVAMRAFSEGQQVLGIRKGWHGIVEVDPDDPQSREKLLVPMDINRVRTVDRTGGTILHSSRTNPSNMRPKDIPEGIDPSGFPAGSKKDTFDLTSRVLENLQKLEVDALVVTGGDDTLGYAAKLNAAGFPCVGIPKTMDNDVSGTDYCLGFSTAITRSVDLITDIRTPAGSHERIAIIELFGRNSGATSLYSGMLSGADRVLISEVPFDMDKLCSMVCKDQDESPSNYVIVVVSEGATSMGGEVMESGEPDAYGHRKLGGIGDFLAEEIKKRTGRETLNQRLAYLMRSGRPDSLDRMVSMNFGNMAYELLHSGRFGYMTALKRGLYQTVPLDEALVGARPLDVAAYYDVDKYRPRLRAIEGVPMFLS